MRLLIQGLACCFALCWVACSSNAGGGSDGGEGDALVTDGDESSDGNWPDGDPTPDGSDGGDSGDANDTDPCSRSFAEEFGESLIVTPGSANRWAFSADCRMLFTVDVAERRLRLTDLVDRTTNDLDADVIFAEFTPDGSRLVFLTPDGDYFNLRVAASGTTRTIASNVGAYSLSPDGRLAAIITDYDPDIPGGTISVVSLEDADAQPVELASDAVGPPLFTPAGEELVFLGGAEPHHHETPNIVCDWYTAEARAHPVSGGATRPVATGVIVGGLWMSETGQWVYTSTDFGCEEQTYTLNLAPLQADAPRTLATDVPYDFPGDFVEAPSRGIVVHAGAFVDPGYELVATSLDGSGKEVLAGDLIPSPWYSLWHVPFRMLGENTLLYLQETTLDVRAVDLDTGALRTVVPSAANLFYEPSPDGIDLLHLHVEQGIWDLLITPIAGGTTRTLRSGMNTLGPPLWASQGERVILQTDLTDELLTIFAINPLTAETHLVSDQTDWMAYDLHPSGWLVFVSRPTGSEVKQIP